MGITREGKFLVDGSSLVEGVVARLTCFGKSAFTTVASIAFGLAVFGFCLSVPAHATDKLTVSDSSNNIKFVVTDTGAVGSGVAAPKYNFDLSSSGVSKSQMHFSLNGNDVGGWLTSVLDNNFWMSSGAAYDASLGGWIQKSSDGESVFAGSGEAGYRVLLQSGYSVGAVISPVQRLKIDYNGNLTVNSLAGKYTNGSAYVCVNDSGVLYTSETGCP